MSMRTTNGNVDVRAAQHTPLTRHLATLIWPRGARVPNPRKGHVRHQTAARDNAHNDVRDHKEAAAWAPCMPVMESNLRSTTATPELHNQAPLLKYRCRNAKTPPHHPHSHNANAFAMAMGHARPKQTKAAASSKKLKTSSLASRGQAKAA